MSEFIPLGGISDDWLEAYEDLFERIEWAQKEWADAVNEAVEAERERLAYLHREVE